MAPPQSKAAHPAMPAQATDQDGASAPGEEFFRAMEARRTRALVQRDLPALEALHAPEYQLVTPTGRILGRAAYLGQIRAAPFYSAWEVLGETIFRRSARMALLRYRARLAFPTGRAIVVWHTDSYEPRPTGWQAVWSQATEDAQASEPGHGDSRGDG